MPRKLGEAQSKNLQEFSDNFHDHQLFLIEMGICQVAAVPVARHLAGLHVVSVFAATEPWHVEADLKKKNKEKIKNMCFQNYSGVPIK